jgi:N-succinyldiaminopimelate aminotransferase
VTPPDPGAFARLRRLLAGEPGPDGVSPAFLHLGEQRLHVPEMLLQWQPEASGWTRYPELGGAQALRDAYAGWLARNFGLADVLATGAVACEPTPGSKQAVAALITLAVQECLRRNSGEPVVAVPIHGYPTYAIAAREAGASVLPYGQDGPGVDSHEALIACQQARLAAIVVCNPGNPEGNVLSAKALAGIADRAVRDGATLIVDECYIDLWLRQPIDTALGLLKQARLPELRLGVLHTLSKRSAAPGLRSGFLAGDAQTVEAYARFNRSCGVAPARPVCEISGALWQDHAHLERLRERLGEAWNIADAALGDLPGYQRPPAGFFLWLPVADGEAAALRLWREAGIMTMPGRYLSVAGVGQGSDAAGGRPGIASGRPGIASGRDRLRISIAQPSEALADALGRMRRAIGPLMSRSAGCGSEWPFTAL